MWAFVAIIVAMTIVISFGTDKGHSQQGNKNKNEEGFIDDLSKYAVVDYNAPEPADEKEREIRKLKNNRYDDQSWVIKNPHPDDSGVGRYDETEPPSLIPVNERSLVIVGKITGVKAYLSNDKQGVYSEFTIKINSILKDDTDNKTEVAKSVIADREGGFVRYPNGQKVLYMNSERALPAVGNEYVFFLTQDKVSPNYKILTLYKLENSGITQLDYASNDFDDFKKMSKQKFTEFITNKIAGRVFQN